MALGLAVAEQHLPSVEAFSFLPHPAAASCREWALGGRGAGRGHSSCLELTRDVPYPGISRLAYKIKGEKRGWGVGEEVGGKSSSKVAVAWRLTGCGSAYGRW